MTIRPPPPSGMYELPDGGSTLAAEPRKVIRQAGDAFNAGYLAFRLLGSTPLQAIGMGQELARNVIALAGARADRSKLRELSIAVEGRNLGPHRP
jgi:sugar/nucleoside kinase (ribokinase family)